MRFGNDEILMRGVCFTSFLIIYPNASNSSPFEGRYQRKRPKESEREKNTLSSNHTWKKKKIYFKVLSGGELPHESLMAAEKYKAAEENILPGSELACW